MIYIIYLYYVFIGLSISYLIIMALVTRNVLRQGGSNSVVQGKLPSVSILKPLKGIDNELEINLVSFFRQDYPDFEIIFGVNDPEDPSLEIVKRLQKQFPGVASKIVIDRRKTCLNPKVNNLKNMSPAVNKEYILISDSNTRVKPDFLYRLSSQIVSSDIGLVTAAVRGMGAQTAAAAMENLHLNTYVAPNVFMAERLFGKPVSIGKAMLMSKETLFAIGGFTAFKNFLGEDYLIGQRISKLGLQVRTVNTFADNINKSWTLKEFISRHSRWAKMRRNMHISYYTMESISNPVAISFILMILMWDLTGVIQFLGVSFFKIIYDIYISRLIKTDLCKKYYLAAPIKDLLISLIWYVPYFSSTVSWRGNRFKIGRQTYLRPAYDSL